MKKRKRNQKSTLLRVLETMCGFLFAIALMLLIWDIQLKKNNSSDNSGLIIPPSTPYVEEIITPDLQIDDGAVEEKKAKPIKEERNVAMPGYKTMNFVAGTDTVSVNLFNPEKNAGYYYLAFELKVPDSNGNYETLYKSDLIEGGKHLYQITLSHALSTGIYEHSILHIQPYTVDELAPTNSADVEFTLIVK